MKVGLVGIAVALGFLMLSCQKSTMEDSYLSRVLPSHLSKQERSIIKNFLNSKEFKRESDSALRLYGKIDFSKISIEYVDGDRRKPILNLLLTGEKPTTALLQVVPIPSNFEDVLPNNDRYAMMVIDYLNFNFETNNGNYHFSDLNYDGSKALEILMINGKVVDAKKIVMFDGIKEKYTGLKTKRQLGNPMFDDAQVLLSRHFCDQNGNGNVSYFECLGCMIYSCGNSFECAGLCGLTEVVAPGYCIGSMAAACVYISVIY
jgi:hypothetical protein